MSHAPENNPLIDRHGRRVTYLRLSVTDRCNLRCNYCMPAEGLPVAQGGRILTDAELLFLAEVFVQLGVGKIRITGGEPLVRPGIVELMGAMGHIPGLKQLAITTNGLRLADLAAGLWAAGVRRVNISVDSLDAEVYGTITRGGDLVRCRAGIDAALALGFETKLNVVVQAGVNDTEVLDFVDLTRNLPLAVRFIEYMPTGGTGGTGGYGALTMPSSELLDRIRYERGDLLPVTPSDRDQAGPATIYRLPDAAGTIGFISAMSCNFCADCNRVRITATGLAQGCLFAETGLDLRPWLMATDQEGLAAAIRQVVTDKPEAHGLGDQEDSDDGPQVAMSRMGG